MCAQAEEQQRAQARHDHDMAALQRMAQRAAALDAELEPDNAFTCRLTMEVCSFFLLGKALCGRPGAEDESLHSATCRLLRAPPSMSTWF